MAKNRSAAGITNIVQYDANRNITFVSGSTTLLTVSSSGALTTSGTITATTLVVQTVTSSVNFITGSTRFGSLSSNTHTFTGSLAVTGGINLNSGSLLVGTNSSIWSNGTTRGVVEINGPSQSILGFDVAGSGAGYIYHDGTNMTVNNGLNGYLALRTNSTTRVTISSSGDMVIGDGGQVQTTGGYYRLRTSASATVGLFIQKNTWTGAGDASPSIAAETGYSISFFTNGNATERMNLSTTGCLRVEGNTMGWTIGQVSGENRIQYNASSFACLNTSNGYTAIAASAFNVNSDYRLKEDLKAFNNALNVVDSIKIYDFKWKDKEERNYGVLAHELQEVLPYTVYGEKDGVDQNEEIITQGVDYGKLVPVLVKAIQELKAQNDSLQSQINELKA